MLQAFCDIESSKNSNRPEMNKANDAMLIVAKLDRLSRIMADIANLMEDKRLKFRVVTMPEADEFRLHIYAALALQERKFTSERTKPALLQAKARGMKLGGAGPQQQARHDAVKAEANQNALSVSKIIGVNRDVGKTYKYIADHLNELCVAAAGGGKWYGTTVIWYDLIIKTRYPATSEM